MTYGDAVGNALDWDFLRIHPVVANFLGHIDAAALVAVFVVGAAREIQVVGLAVEAGGSFFGCCVYIARGNLGFAPLAFAVLCVGALRVDVKYTFLCVRAS